MTTPATLADHCPVLRQALAADIPGINDVRYAVRENTLRRGIISDEDVRREIEDSGRGWVVQEGGRIVAFAIGNARSGNIWALFVAPGCEGRGHGRRLHDVMVQWLWAQGLSRLWLTTGPGTRALDVYRHFGWQLIGPGDHGDLRLELQRPAAVSASAA